MATQTSDAAVEMDSTGVWLLQRVVSTVFLVPIGMVVLAAFSSPAIYLTFVFYPVALPFVLLALLDRAFAVVGGFLKEGIPDDTPMQDHAGDPSDDDAGLVLLLSSAMFMSSLSVQIGLIGALAGVVATTFPVPILALFVPFVAPHADAYAYNKLGVSVAYLGMLLPASIFLVLARLQVLSDADVQIARQRGRAFIEAAD